MVEAREGLTLEPILAIPYSLEYSGQMAVWHERIPTTVQHIGQFDPEDPLDADEGMMDDDMTPPISYIRTFILSYSRCSGWRDATPLASV